MTKHLTRRWEWETGYFVDISYKINTYLEPVFRYDQADFGADNTFKRSTAGLIFYPQPELISHFNFKINYSFVHDDEQGNKDNEFILQVAIGF